MNKGSISIEDELDDEPTGPVKLRTRESILADCPIQKGIPIPRKRNGPKSPWREKFIKLEVGDSFFVDNLRRTTAANRYASELGIEITYRKVGKGMRFWRVK